MLKHSENPIQFNVNKNIGDINVRYFNLMEIGQGGPEVGNIALNNHEINGRYGGPILCDDNYLYIPAYIRKKIGWGFKLARINLVNYQVAYFGKFSDLIFLDKKEDGVIYYYNDLNRSILSQIKI